MKKHIKNWGFFLLVLLCYIAGARLFILNYQTDASIALHTENFIKVFFLFTDSNLFKQISSSSFISIFISLLFMSYNLNIFLFESTKKYRSMVLLRFGSRLHFFQHNIKVICKNSTLIVLAATISFILAAIINSIPFYFSYNEYLPVVFLLLNYILFLNIIGLVNLFCIMRFKAHTAITAVSIFIGAFLFFDAFETQFAIIAYGNMQQEVKGFIILICIYIIFYFISSRVLKKLDVL